MKPMDLPKQLGQIAKKLRRAGIQATLRPDQIPVPGAWVMVSEIDAQFLSGQVIEGEYQVTLVARDLGSTSALAQLCEMLERVGEVLPPPTKCDITNLQLPGQGAVLPALTLTYDF